MPRARSTKPNNPKLNKSKQATKQALQIAEQHKMPDICKSLNNAQIAFCEEYVRTLNVKTACKKANYSYQHGTRLLKDLRVQSYLNHLRSIYDAVSILSKGQIIEKIGQRILSNDIEDKDLASLSREARALQNIGQNDAITQINIKLPDTYNQFFAKDSNQAANDADDAEIVDEW